MNTAGDAMLRYVVLHHTGIDAPHYDLMFETAPSSLLATWRFRAWPPAAYDSVEQLGDHRRDYLVYEGAVSGNRGSVSRVERGGCQVERSSDIPWLIRLFPEPPQRAIELRIGRDVESRWICVADY